MLSPLETIPIDDFRRQIEVNLTAQVAVTQAFLPLVRRATGRVVFVSSIAGRMALPFGAPSTTPPSTGSRQWPTACARSCGPWKIGVAREGREVDLPRPHGSETPHRYVVGADARGQAIARRVLPDRAFDSLVARIMRL